MQDDKEAVLQWLRGRRVRCTCGEVLAVFRRRRFYPLVEVVCSESGEAVVRCPGCGREHHLRDLVRTWERRR